MNKDGAGPLLDIDAALTHVAGDRDLLAELSAMFVEDYPHMLEQAGKAVDAGDYRTVERVAHTLKGRLAFFGIHAAVESAAELEAAGRNNNPAAAGAALAIIKAMLGDVLHELERLSGGQNR